MDIEEINADRDKFLINISQNVEQEMRKIGLKLINVNVTDIRDESGYIEALGKEAAAKAINEAKRVLPNKNVSVKSEKRRLIEIKTFGLQKRRETHVFVLPMRMQRRFQVKIKQK